MTAPSPLLAASTERLAEALCRIEEFPDHARVIACGRHKHLAEALLASGAVVPAASLADDMKRLVATWEAERHEHRHAPGAPPSQIDAGIRATLRACADDLRALAAALEDR